MDKVPNPLTPSPIHGEGESTALVEIIGDTQLDFISMEVLLDDLADSVSEQDENSHALIAAAMDQHELIKSRVEELHQAVGEAVDLAKEAVRLVREERNKAFDELTQLKSAIDDPWNVRNKEIDDLREELQENIESGISEMLGEFDYYASVEGLELTFGIEGNNARELADVVHNVEALTDQPEHYAELLSELIEALRRYAEKDAAG